MVFKCKVCKRTTHQKSKPPCDCLAGFREVTLTHLGERDDKKKFIIACLGKAPRVNVSYTSSIFAVTCPKCQEIIKLRKQKAFEENQKLDDKAFEVTKKNLQESDEEQYSKDDS